MASQTDLQEKLLECPVCYERLIPPVQTCGNGHAICWKCRQFLQFCGLCKRRFIDGPNTLLNQLIETIPVKCKFNSEGCWESLSLTKIGNHEGNCGYRKVECYYCGQKGIIVNQLNEHFAKHDGGARDQLHVSTFKSIILNSRDTVHSIYLINVETYFLLRFHFQGDILYFCAQYMGENQQEAGKYRYDIKIDQGLLPPNKCYFRCSGLCVPYRFSKEETVQQENLLELHLKSIFLNKEYLSSNFKFEIQIKPLSVPT